MKLHKLGDHIIRLIEETKELDTDTLADEPGDRILGKLAGIDVLINFLKGYALSPFCDTPKIEEDLRILNTKLVEITEKYNDTIVRRIAS
jgi:hypothetical protein